jgi:glycerol uptake facilitator-like aquaporin
MKARALFAEGLGTALLVFFGAGAATLSRSHHKYKYVSTVT